MTGKLGHYSKLRVYNSVVMEWSYRYLRFRLREAGLLPSSKLAKIAWYLLGLDAFLFALQKLLGLFRSSYAQSLGGWITFLSIAVIFLFLVLAFRWLKAKMLWRLRNRLIVTYVFIGVIPVVLLVVLALGSLYLFAGQFATFIVTTRINSELESLDASNSAFAHALAMEIQNGRSLPLDAPQALRQASSDKEWRDRQVFAWLNRKIILESLPPGVTPSSPSFPSPVKLPFRNIVRDHNKLFLRAAETISTQHGNLTVLSSEPLDQHLLEELSADLGEVTLFASGLNLRRRQATTSRSDTSGTDLELDTKNVALVQPDVAGSVPPATRSLDREVSFLTSLYVMDWETGDPSKPAAVSVRTRFSKLYDRLFAAAGHFAPTVESALFFVAIVFGIIELFALFIGTRLTRTVTGAVAHLYNATTHVNRGDLSYRIPVKSKDQLATLAHSFNSMAASLENLLEEQRQKQRLENELLIAQEVQAQLFPHSTSGLAALEVHGFCRPARTVSGDYYDFLAVDSDRLILAVGDVSGKGISAALLMATIHSAVRAYSMEGMPGSREAATVATGTGSSLLLASSLPATEVSPAALLSLLNHQLYESTPMEKYATLFMGIYGGSDGRLTYSNGGHLPPIVLSEDGSIRRLDRGGMVVGLFDDTSYEEASVQLHKGEIFLAYSDGVTEPENEFGEFGEERLIELVWKNRHLPLVKICEIVTAAVDDWIGDNEQPDDVTLVLARAR